MSDLFDDSQVPSETPQDVVIDDQGPFVIVPMKLYLSGIGSLAIAVYVGIRSHANRKRGNTTFVLSRTLATELLMGESTVRREINNLRDAGWLEKTLRKGRSTIYRITEPRYGIAETPLHSSTSPLPRSDITIRSNYKKVTNKENIAFVLPEWINKGTWQAFEEMRTRNHKRMTDFARQRIVNKLQTYRDAGLDHNESLARSVERCWSGVFEPTEGNGNGKISQFDQWCLKAQRECEAAEEAKSRDDGTVLGRG